MLIAIRNAISTHLLISLPPKSKHFHGLQFQEPNPFVCFCFLKSPMSSSQIVAEYAKSNRSSCKKCFKSIGKDAPRLGLVSRDARGFDLTKWHHLECFPNLSEPISSVEVIKGFTAMKSVHQEALRKLVLGDDTTPEEGSDGGDDVAEGTIESSKKLMVLKRDRDAEDDIQEENLKRVKLSTSLKEAELDIAFSISDIKDKYKDATLLSKWKAYQTLIFLERDDGLRDSNKIAAFDFDGCLAKTSVRRVGADAWSLMYPSIPDKLQSLYNDGYKLVIFTNESNIERWKNKRQAAIDSKIGRLNSFIKKVNVPVQVFIACGLGQSAEDPFRKPKPGMWQIMKNHFNSGIAIDTDQSFYVGDAAGRPSDHGDADIKFAEIIGLKFYVPEEYFDT